MLLSGPDLVSRLTPRIAKQCIRRAYDSLIFFCLYVEGRMELGVAIGDLLMLHALPAPGFELKKMCIAYHVRRQTR
jgi:hypothetical protein